MLFSVHKNRLPLGFRLTALTAAALVWALSIFAASPILHAWLHGHDHSRAIVAQSREVVSNTPADHHSPAPNAADDDDGCIITLFAAGILAAVYYSLLRLFFGKVEPLAHLRAAKSVYTAPRYWLPPLCGPPVS